MEADRMLRFSRAIARVGVASIALSLATAPALAQTQAGSPVRDILTKAKNALNDLKYKEADSLAARALSYGALLSKDEQLEATQVLVAALYPEDVGDQKLDSVHVAIKQMLALGVKLMPRRQVHGVGFDSHGPRRGLDSCRLPSTRVSSMIALSKGQLLRTACVALAVVVSPVAAPLRAQVPTQQGTSVMDDILKRAEDALNDLNYKSAIDFAKQVVDVGPRATPAQRTRALFVIGAANYPEGEPAAQHRDVALATFKQLVSANFDLVIPQTIRWAGLDSILADAKRTTFAVPMTAPAAQIFTGPAANAD